MIRPLGTLAVTGLFLVGVGAPALTVGISAAATSGSAAAAISSPTASAACRTATGRCTSITIPAGGLVGSTFDTSAVPITVTNVGTAPLSNAALSITASVDGPPGAALEQGINVCIQGSRSTVLANGPLSVGLGLTPSVALGGPTLAPGTSTAYHLSFYAGEDSACGRVVSSDPATAQAWSTPPLTPASGYKGTGIYRTPPSLTNAAENGNVTVKLTVELTSSVAVQSKTSSSSSGAGSSTGSDTSSGSPARQTVPVSTTASTESSLAFTGAEIAAMVVAGLSLVVGGLLFLLLSRRRRSQPTGSDPPQG